MGIKLDQNQQAKSAGGLESKSKELKNYYWQEHVGISKNMMQVVNSYVGNHMDRLNEMVENYYTDIVDKNAQITKAELPPHADSPLYDRFMDYYDRSTTDDLVHLGTLMNRAMHNGIIQKVDLVNTVFSLKTAIYSAEKVLEKYFDIKLEKKGAKDAAQS